MRKIVATLVAATVVIVFVLVATKAGRDIDAATQRFMLYYAGVFALIGLTGSVIVGLVATDRIVMTPGHRIMAQAVHRAVSFGALAFLFIHIVTEILAQRAHVIDAVIPFLSPYRTFYIGLGTIASDIIVLIVITSILRKRFTAHARAWRWRAIHYSSYVAFVFGVLHGLLGGRTAKPYVDWSYGFAIAVTALGLAVRFLAISLRPKESLGSAPSTDRARPSGSSPLHAAAMSRAQAQLGGAVQVLPAGPGLPGGRGVGPGMTGPDSWAALPAPGWSPSSGPLPALDPAPAYAGSSSASAGYRDLGFTPLGAPPSGNEGPSVLRGRPNLAADQPRPALARSAGPARQPCYEPGYDGPPRFVGAPRGHGDVPRDELSSYPYGPQRHRPPPVSPYLDVYGDHGGSGAHTSGWPGPPEPVRLRAAISAAARQADRNSGPMPRLDSGPMSRPGTGPMSRPGTGPMPRPDIGPLPRPDSGPAPRPDTGAFPRVDTGPIPRVDTGPVPRVDTGPVPRVGSGPAPRHGTGPMPRAGSGPMPRIDSGPMSRPGTGPMRRPDSGPMPRPDGGSMPRPDIGPLPRLDPGAAPRPDTGPLPQVGPGPAPRHGTGPMRRAGTGPMPRAESGPMPRLGTGPMPRPGTGAAPRPDGGLVPRPDGGAVPRPDGGPVPRPDTGRLPRLDPGSVRPGATGPGPRAGTGPMPRPGTGPTPRVEVGSPSRPGTGPLPRPGQPMPAANTVTMPRTGPLPGVADRPSHRAKPNDPRYRDMSEPTGGAEWS